MSSSRSTFFHNYLKNHKIGEPSTAVPDRLRRANRAIPSESDLEEVPDLEQFPIDLAPKSEKIEANELRILFLQTQLQRIANEPSLTNISSEDVNVVGPILEIPTEFASVKDYIKHKRELATAYKKRSDEYGWPKPVGVCMDPLCMNSTAPSFQYCLYHIEQDPLYSKINLFSKCQAETNEPCHTPCGIGQSRCAFHSKETK
ncbi:hypothetical protein GPJ56_006265 [Histomonas meleagridis]|uniref:uncharacterized protein n=1 Tax=Histomonas meleagridis TaxID=135588 RepID=UPI0035599B4D|nr:hypothetical protein GPJ56_006265 [Histomonas meleagridis]KAH0796919.1 hypothetical protein GO595_010812 [Histomonas meleagridis]